MTRRPGFSHKSVQSKMFLKKCGGIESIAYLYCDIISYVMLTMYSFDSSMPKISRGVCFYLLQLLLFRCPPSCALPPPTRHSPPPPPAVGSSGPPLKSMRKEVWVNLSTWYTEYVVQGRSVENPFELKAILTLLVSPTRTKAMRNRGGPIKRLIRIIDIWGSEEGGIKDKEP